MRLFAGLSSNLKKLLIQLLVFFTLFIVISATIGSSIIGTKLLYSWYFFIYANMGKLLLYATIVFILLIRERIRTIKYFNFQKVQLFFLGIAVISYFLLFSLLKQLLALPTFTSNILLSITTHLVLIILVITLLLGVFGVPFLSYLLRRFKKELVICLGIAILFYGAIFYVWGFWQYLSGFVLSIEYLLFFSFYPTLHVIPPYTLSFPTFSIVIGESCSGLDSIFLFTALYAIIWIIEKKNLNWKKMALMFIPALIGTIIVNIIRVSLLILVGLFISPILAATLFHTYLGMLLFIIYFFIFWRLLYRWMNT